MSTMFSPTARCQRHQHRSSSWILPHFPAFPHKAVMLEVSPMSEPRYRIVGYVSRNAQDCLHRMMGVVPATSVTSNCIPLFLIISHHIPHHIPYPSYPRFDGYPSSVSVKSFMTHGKSPSEGCLSICYTHYTYVSII
jgi:hypothetical protein